MEILMDQIKALSDAAAALHQDQNHEGSRHILNDIKILLEQADEYQRLKQEKLEAYLHG